MLHNPETRLEHPSESRRPATFRALNLGPLGVGGAHICRLVDIVIATRQKATGRFGFGPSPLLSVFAPGALRYRSLGLIRRMIIGADADHFLAHQVEGRGHASC